MPFQHLATLLTQIVTRARTVAAMGTKTINHGLKEIDVMVTNASNKTLDNEQKAKLNIVKAGGGTPKSSWENSARSIAQTATTAMPPIARWITLFVSAISFNLCE